MPEVRHPEVVVAAARRTDGYLPIEDYGAIGDGRTLALIGVDGSLDWMCLPNLDGPSAFAALLDAAHGGSFSLCPAISFRVERHYVSRTNVLHTDFSTAEGTVCVTEAVTIDSSQNAPWRELVRQVEATSGQVPMQWRLRPRFGYGQRPAEPDRRAGGFIYRDGDLQMALRTWDAR